MVIDPKRDALVVVDVQNDFCPGGSLAVSDGDRVVPVLNGCAERFWAAGAPIYASRDWHPARTRHFKEYGGAWPPHCVQGTWGAAFHGDLRLPSEAEVISKGMDPEEDAYSCFQAVDARGTRFSDALRARGASRLWVGGLATDYCVRATVLDARKEGFEVLVLEDAIKGVDITPGDSEKAVEEMKAAGARFIRWTEA